MLISQTNADFYRNSIIMKKKTIKQKIEFEC